MPDYALVLDGEEIGIDFDETVEHYPYRTATVRDRFKEEDLDEGSERLHRLLAREAGVCVDNHVVYGVTLDNGRKLYVFFHDLKVIYGWSMEKRDW